MANKSSAQLLAEILANLPDNKAGAITASVLRSILTDLVDSAVAPVQGDVDQAVADALAAQTTLVTTSNFLAFEATLGQAAFSNIGTTAGTVAAGNDSRIANAVQSNGFLAALTNAAVSLPTSLPSTAGQLWNNGGVISIS